MTSMPTKAAPSPSPTDTTDSNSPRAVDSEGSGPVFDDHLKQRVASLIIILLPLVGLIAAMVYMWGWGLGWVELTLLATMYLVSGLGVTVGFHRLFAHKSFSTSPTVTALLGVAGSMSVEGSILQWVSNHRCHHRHSDQEGDPHSPHCHDGGVWNVLKGAWRAHMGWLFSATQPSMDRWVPDLKRSRLVMTISKLFPLWALLGLLIPAALGGLITLSWMGAFLGFLWGGLVRVFFIHHVTWSVNSICHLWGTRPFRSNDESRNNPIVGVLALGEGWHNNHHAFPASARHGLAWWQIDISYLVIKAMEKLGLVWNVRVPAPERIAAKRR